jgi:hypothetical protein
MSGWVQVVLKKMKEEQGEEDNQIKRLSQG